LSFSSALFTKKKKKKKKGEGEKKRMKARREVINILSQGENEKREKK